MDDTPNEPSVPVKELRALIEEWRYAYEQSAGSSGHLEVAKAFDKCSNELEAVIEDYE